MLTNTRRHVLKQGWVYKRGAPLLGKWKLKWLVLYEVGVPNSPATHSLLCVYDQRDHAVQGARPKHAIDAGASLRVDTPESADVEKSWFGNKTKVAPFIVTANSRRYYFSAQSKKDRDEWASALRQHAPHHAPMQSGQRTVSAVDAALDAEESMSVFSETATDITSVSKRPATAVGNDHHDDGDSESMCTYATGGLSFCSTTVLTPFELNQLGRLGNSRHAQASVSTTAGLGPLTPEDAWNARYQCLLTSKCASQELTLEKDVKLCDIVGRFTELAQMYGRKIIDEYHAKAPRAADADSIPGTYHFGNIVFHFATGYDDLDNDNIEIDVRKASQELRNINAVNRINSGLHTTLMCLVDYKGFRLVAYASMPLKEQQTVILDLTSVEPVLNDIAINKVLEVGSQLNLKEHSLALKYDRRLAINLSATTEIHQCPETHELYALNLCDVFPIDHPTGTRAKLNPTHRLRPEFVKSYRAPLCSDAFTQFAYSRRERDINDSEAMHAAKYLRDTHVPAFVRKLDDLTVLPIGSRSFTEELHAHGINVRHIGLIARLTRLPYVRDLCFTEMVARACKALFHARLRRAVFHFKNVEATRIEEEMQTYVISFVQTVLGNGTQTERFFKEKLQEAVETKFGYNMDYSQYIMISKPALFLSLQHHCGFRFRDLLDYNFNSPTTSITQADFVEFTTQSKTPTSMPKHTELTADLNEEDKHVYFLARHLAQLGPTAKLDRNDTTAQILNALAKHYNATGRYEEARFYLTAALNLASGNHPATALIYANMMETVFYVTDHDFGTVNQLYDAGLAILDFHASLDHPLAMALHDMMASLYCRKGVVVKALEYHRRSMETARKTLGKNHVVAAGQLTRAGHLLLQLSRHEEGIQHFNDALQILEALPQSNSVATSIAENHSCIAEGLYAKGDSEGALKHSHECRKLREKILGPMHPQTVDTYRQFARLVMAPYEDYEGVITPHVKKNYQTAIMCYERVFKYVKSRRDNPQQKKHAILELVRTITNLKFRLLTTSQKEYLRHVRHQPKQYGEDVVREAILKLVHLSPTVYIDEIMQRIEDREENAEDELDVVVQLIESDVVALS